MFTMFAYLVVNHPQWKGITISDYEYRISQFADDTVIFLKDKSIVKKALNIISVFSGAQAHPSEEKYAKYTCSQTNCQYISSSTKLMIS